MEEDDREIDETKKSSDILLIYSDQLFAGIIEFLGIATA